MQSSLPTIHPHTHDAPIIGSLMNYYLGRHCLRGSRRVLSAVLAVKNCIAAGGGMGAARRAHQI